MATEDSSPSYPELILAAIESINSKEGASKSAISKHIEANNDNLPASHSTLLTENLDKMKESGELVMVKNNYLKADVVAPARRGRGRPPKPKVTPPPGTVVSTPRPRGRPPKPLDPLAPPKKATPASSGRKRGRPPKLDKVSPEVKRAVPPTGTPKGRGRQSKDKAPIAAPVGA